MKECEWWQSNPGVVVEAWLPWPGCGWHIHKWLPNWGGLGSVNWGSTSHRIYLNPQLSDELRNTSQLFVTRVEPKCIKIIIKKPLVSKLGIPGNTRNKSPQEGGARGLPYRQWLREASPHLNMPAPPPQISGDPFPMLNCHPNWMFFLWFEDHTSK